MKERAGLYYYEQQNLWSAPLTQRELTRVQTTIDMIPNNVQSVLDIGCGDGRITNKVHKPVVLGIDFARTHLIHIEPPAAQASIEALPLVENYFDLVIISEVLEHLSHDAFHNATREIKRLGAKYLLISVPFNEVLENQLARCRDCGHLFHLYHHYQTFDDRWFRYTFKDYRLERISFINKTIRVSNTLIKIKHKCHIYNYSETAVCDKCGGRPVIPHKLNQLPFSGLSFIEHHAKSKLNKGTPSHQIVLLKRTNQG